MTKLPADLKRWDNGDIFYSDKHVEVLLRMEDGTYVRFEREFYERRWDELPCPLTERDREIVAYFQSQGLESSQAAQPF